MSTAVAFDDVAWYLNLNAALAEHDAILYTASKIEDGFTIILMISNICLDCCTLLNYGHGNCS